MQSNILQIDERLSIDPLEILGTGPKSVVFKGTYEGIPVAVKRIKNEPLLEVERDPSEAAKQACRERDIMCQVEKDRRWNIVGYHYSVQQEQFTFLALQLCNGHLESYIKSTHLVSTYPPQKVNRDIAVAVQYLHRNNIVHRDLKPENIFYCLNGDRVEKVLVGDFGFSKTTIENMYSMSSLQVGTQGYISQEVWNQLSKNDPNFRNRMTVKSDIFAMCCIFYYTATSGKNPFGTLDSQTNIGRKVLPHFDELEPKQHILRCLLENGLSHNPEKRPDATQILNHPAVWPPEKILKFLMDASDDVEDLAPSNQSEIAKLEKDTVILGGNWCTKLPESLRKHLDNFKMYDKHVYRGNSRTVRGTLRVIRNVAHHFKEFPPPVRQDLGPFPDGHLDVWLKSCPLLFMHVYETISGIRRNLGIRCDLSEYTETVVEQHKNGQHVAVQLPESQSEEIRQQTNFGGDDQNTEMKTSSRLCYRGNQSEKTHQQTNTGRADQNIELETTTRPIFHDDLSSLSEDMIGLNMSRGIGDARAITQTRSSSLEKIIHVKQQKEHMHHFTEDIWMQMAKKEVVDGKDSEVRHFIGQYYILLIDISESMAEGSAWHQTKHFVYGFMESLENLQEYYSYVPVYLALVTFGLKTEVVQRLTNEISQVRRAFDTLSLGGPTPLYGGIALGTATAGIPERVKGKPRLITITDGKPTATTLYAGPDISESSQQAEVMSTITRFLEEVKNSVELIFVPVGNSDSDFISVMAGVSGGSVYSHEDGCSILRQQISGERDEYYESKNYSLPSIGSRVIRGIDWCHENQDSRGPGTVIGHKPDVNAVWVEWDEDGHKNCYRYGLNGQYDVLLTDEHKRSASQTGAIFVGCIVTEVREKSDPRNPDKIGTVIKVLQGGGQVEVRWTDGKRGNYSFGQNNKYEVWPHDPDTPSHQQSETGEASGTSSVVTTIQHDCRTTRDRKKINKNAVMRKPRQ